MTDEERIAFAEKISLEPSERASQYALRALNKQSGVLIMRCEWVLNPQTGRKERRARLTCTECGQTCYEAFITDEACRWQRRGFRAPTIQAYEHENILCPMCGAPVTVIHSGYISESYQFAYYYVTEAINCEGHLAIVTHYTTKECNSKGEVNFCSYPHEAFVFIGKKTYKYKGWGNFMYSRYYHNKWTSLTTARDNNPAREILPIKLDVLRQTGAENSKLDIYCKEKQPFPVTYMRLWLKHPQVENLIMQKAGYLVTEMIDKASHYHLATTNVKGINWKEKSPFAMLNMDKVTFKNEIKTKHWNLNELLLYQEAKKQGILLSGSDIYMCNKYGYNECSSLIKEGLPLLKILRYLDRQEKKTGHFTGIWRLKDYWKMLRLRGVETPEQNYPQDLHKAHDQESERQRLEKDELMAKEFMKRKETLDKYCFQSAGTGLTIRPAHSPEELFKEGQALLHCVYSYKESHAKGNTAIFFIRKQDTPGESFFTLELNEKTLSVKQNRGMRNCARTKEVEVFEAEWLDYIKNIRKEEEKNGKRNDKSKCRTA